MRSSVPWLVCAIAAYCLLCASATRISAKLGGQSDPLGLAYLATSQLGQQLRPVQDYEPTRVQQRCDEGGCNVTVEDTKPLKTEVVVKVSTNLQPDEAEKAPKDYGDVAMVAGKRVEEGTTPIYPNLGARAFEGFGHNLAPPVNYFWQLPYVPLPQARSQVVAPGYQRHPVWWTTTMPTPRAECVCPPTVGRRLDNKLGYH